LVAES
jgi:hypothetical protein